jgi:exopolyphosphatase/guanosine-5'-triphosphate,3'-diphosphate pyrophosphatase
VRIAVFDIGTNSIHMLVVEVHKDLSFGVLDHEKDTTRLGDGSFETKRLSRIRMARAFRVLEKFVKIAARYKVKKMFGVATSAVRDAKNGRQFTEAIYKRTGARIRIISGEEEGRLIFLGASSGVDIGKSRALLIDIGGGSAEFILGDKERILFNESFPLGAARLTDHFIHKDPPSKKELKRLEKHIAKEIRPTIKKIKGLGFSEIVGTAGTMINLASMVYEEKESKPFKLTNHFRMHTKDLKKIHKKLVDENLRELLKMPGLDLKRADIINAGSVFVNKLLKNA